MVELFVLGGVDLREDGDRLEAVLSQPKRAALLCYLAVARPQGFHARDVLLALFWPESDRRRARSSLRKALHFLRRHLGKRAILSSGDALGLGSDIWCDAAAFDRALEQGDSREALDLYRGDLLSGFHVSNAPEFERWLDGERRRLRRCAVRTAWGLARQEEEAGRPIEAARFAHRAHAIDPLDELNVRRLMGLLHRLGDGAGPLRVYEQAEARLWDELEMKPTAETRELRDRIREEVEPESPPDGTPPSPPDDAEAETSGTAPAIPGPGPAVSGARAPTGSRRPTAAVLAGVLALVLLLGGGLSVRQIVSDAGATAHGTPVSTIAVLPFGIGGDERPLWREGMASLLSTTLHGTAGLEAREPEHVLKLWQSEFDDAAPTAASSREAGRRLRAGWVVTGTLMGRDGQVRLSAEARRVADGEGVGPVIVDGPRDSLFTLVDRLTVELLRRGVLPADRDALTVDLSRVTTTSLAALEAYLEGEQAWRSARIREAADAFSRAVRHDSAFALAHHRLAIAYFWTGPFGAALPHLRAAVRHADRLHDREASVARATLALREGAPADAIDTLRALTTRDPTYAEGWVRYGDAILHQGPKLLLPLADSRRALLRAVEANPLAAEPYWHLIDDAFFREDSAEASRLVDAYRRVDPNSWACIGYEIAYALTWGDATDRSAAERRLPTLGGKRREPLACSLSVLELAPRHRAALEAVARELESEDRTEAERRRAGRFRNQADVRAGRIAAALASAREAYDGENRERVARRNLLIALMTYHDPEASAEATRILRDEPTPEGRFWLAASALHHGRVDEALRIAAALRAEAASSETADLARAIEVLASTDVGVDKSEVLREVRAEDFIDQWLRFRAGEILLERGEPDRALRFLESFGMYSYPMLAPSFLLQGKAHEARGDTAAARDAYRRFLRWWRDADPELEPRKREARDALARLAS